MALKTFLGVAPVVPGVKTITVTSATAAQTQIVSAGSRSETYINGTGLTTAQVAANLYAQLFASKAPEFQELQFAYPGTGAVITVSHTDFAQDFTLALSGTGAPTLATVAATTGPGDWGNAANWTGGTLPVNNDDILVDLPDTVITQNLEALVAVDIGTFTVRNRANYGIGLPEFKRSGASVYREYRTRFVKVKTIDTLIVDGDGSGPRVLNISTVGAAGVGNCTATISSNSNSPSDENAPIQLNLLGSGNVIDLTRGLVGIPATGVIATARVGRETDNDESPELWNDGALTNLFNLGGRTRSSTAIAAFTQNRGAVDHDQTAGNLTGTVEGGRVICRGDATYDLDANGPNTIIDWSRSTKLKTVAGTSTFRNGVNFYDPHGRTAGQNVRNLCDSLTLQRSVFGDAA